MVLPIETEIRHKFGPPIEHVFNKTLKLINEGGKVIKMTGSLTPDNESIVNFEVSFEGEIFNGSLLNPTSEMFEILKESLYK